MWKHSYLEAGAPHPSWRFYSTTAAPCTILYTGMCNVPRKLNIGRESIRLMASHLGNVIYDYKGTLNPLLDTSWQGGILTNVNMITDLCTINHGVFPEPEMGPHAYLGVTWDKANQGDYVINCDTDEYSNALDLDCRWENCHLPSSISRNRSRAGQSVIHDCRALLGPCSQWDGERVV